MRRTITTTLTILLSISCIASKFTHPLLYGDYAEEWKLLAHFEAKNQPKEALAVAVRLYTRAKADGNQPQMLLALLSAMRYRIPLEEDHQAQNLRRFEAEMASAPVPLQNVMESMYATMLLGIRRSHSYQNERGKTEFYWWGRLSPEQLHIQAKTHLLRSLEKPEVLQSTRLSSWDAALDGSRNARRYRPTLYDLLAWRAVGILEVNMLDSEALRDSSESPNVLTDLQCLAPADRFIQHKFDTLVSPRSIGTIQAICQDLTRFHLREHRTDALIEVELKRLSFASEHIRLVNADSLYMESLLRTARDYADQDTSLRISHELAMCLQRLRPKWNRTTTQDLKAVKRLKQAIANAVARHPKATRARELTVLLDSDSEGFLSLETDPYLIPGKPLEVRLNYRNADHAWIRIVANSKDFSWKHRDRKAKQLLSQPTCILDTLVMLPADWEGRIQTVKIVFPGLPAGKYLIAGSHGGAFGKGVESYVGTRFTVTSMAWMTRHDHLGKPEMLVVDRETGMPLQDVWASLDGKGKVSSKPIRSNEAGIISIPVNPADPYGLTNVSLRRGSEYVTNAQRGLGADRWASKPEKPDTSMMFFTDRSIYRPGQIIYYKCIAVRDSAGLKETLRDFNTKVVLRAAGHDTLGVMRLTTNSFGSLSGQFQIPKSVRNGQFMVSNKYGGTGLRIEEYRRPQFEVWVTPDGACQPLGDRISVTGKAMRYSGAAVSNALVKFSVEEENLAAYFPGRWALARRYQFPCEQFQASGSARTGADGRFELDIPFKLNVLQKERFRLFPPMMLISLTVVDENGESVTASAVRGNTSDGYSTHVYAQDQFLRGNPASFRVSCSSSYGKKGGPFRGSYKIQMLVAEPGKRPMEWQAGGAVVQAGDACGTGAIEIPMGNMEQWQSGVYRISYTSHDGEQKDSVTFELFGSKDSLVPGYKSLWMMEDRVTGGPGDTATYWLGTSEEEVYVLEEWEVGKRIVLQEWKRLRRGVQRVAVPLTEEFRQGLTIHLTQFSRNEFHNEEVSIRMRDQQNSLRIQYGTFREKLQPGMPEEWTARVSGPNGAGLEAELLACMYDASLDAIQPHGWNTVIGNALKARRQWKYNVPEKYVRDFSCPSKLASATYPFYQQPQFEEINWTRFFMGSANWEYDELNYRKYTTTKYYLTHPWNLYRLIFHKKYKNLPPRRGTRTLYINDLGGDDNGYVPIREITYSMNADPKRDLPTPLPVKDNREPNSQERTHERPMIRKDLKETAFFLPELRTDAQGNVVFKFTSPEALSRWRVMAFAHTTSMGTGYREDLLITQKPLMIVPFPPRFLREGDSVQYRATVSNLTNTTLSGLAKLALLDGQTMLPADDIFGNQRSERPFSVEPGGSTVVEWRLHVPNGPEALVHRATAEAQSFTDGEESALPILPNAIQSLVTRTAYLPAHQQVTLDFSDAPQVIGSSSQIQGMSLEIAGNPNWEAILALPYMMQFPYECAEQTFSRYYANTVAATILGRYPAVAAHLKQWQSGEQPAPESPLDRASGHRAIQLAETPWLHAARNDRERIRNLARLLDPSRMRAEMDTMLSRLKSLNTSEGFRWFEGFRRDRYISQHILIGMGHLQQMKAILPGHEHRINGFIRNGISWIFSDLAEQQRLTKVDPSISKLRLRPIDIHALYALSFLRDGFETTWRKAVWKDCILGLSKETKFNGAALSAMAALILHRAGEAAAAREILKDLRNQAIVDPQQGMHWEPVEEWFDGFGSQIEEQALLIEAFDEVTHDSMSVGAMQQWLLFHKQGNHWGSTKATANACYALLRNAPAAFQPMQQPVISMASGQLPPFEEASREANIGHFERHWSAEQVRPDLFRCTITNPNSQPVFARYTVLFEGLPTRPISSNGLRVERSLWKVDGSNGGKRSPIQNTGKMEVGEVITVKIAVETDRDLSYVHIRDPHAAGFEPVLRTSGYAYESGTSLYRTVQDVSLNYFISWLPKGKYVFEYPLRATHQGDFSNGITTIQCMYAPEFTSHSEGIRVKIGG